MSTAAPAAVSGTAPSAGRAKDQPAWLWPVVGLGGAILLVIVGYWLSSRPSNEELPTAYGRRRGSTEFVRSVSGTSVLAEMFKAAGHRTTSWTRLSPRLDDYDVIVWAPDDFAAPTKEQRQFLEDWLARGEGVASWFISAAISMPRRPIGTAFFRRPPMETGTRFAAASLVPKRSGPATGRRCPRRNMPAGLR